MPDYNETVVRIDHDAGLAQVWTPNARFRRMMERAGAKPLERQISGQWWEVPANLLAKGIRFGKSVREQSPAAREARISALVKAREARRSAK